MKIMSFNTQHCLNYISREIDFNIMADTIKKCGADKGTYPDACKLADRAN